MPLTIISLAQCITVIVSTCPIGSPWKINFHPARERTATLAFLPPILRSWKVAARLLSILASVSPIPGQYLCQPAVSISLFLRCRTRLTGYFLFRSLKHFCFAFISGSLFHSIMYSRQPDRFPATMGKRIARRAHVNCKRSCAHGRMKAQADWVAVKFARGELISNAKM